MIKATLIVGLFSVLLAKLALASSFTFPSTVDGVSIGNTHLVADEEGQIYRGSAPLGKIDELVKLGITDILIFKNQTGTEVDKELEEIEASNKANPESPIQSTHISFRWQKKKTEKYYNYAQGCRQVVRALKILDEVSQSKKRKLFFHCTIGEDRTGLLAGLYLVMKGKTSTRGAFETELCPKGYEAGNPEKGKNVVGAIRRDITPLYLKMGFLIEEALKKEKAIDEFLCSAKNLNKAKQALKTEDFHPNTFACEPAEKPKEKKDEP